MTSRLRENESFARLMLTTSRQQQKAILDTLTDEQVAVITEILYNLLYVVPMNDRERKSLLRKKVYKDIANAQRSHRFRRSKIRASMQQLLNVINNYSTQILSSI